MFDAIVELVHVEGDKICNNVLIGSESGFYLFKKMIYNLYFVYVVEALITSDIKRLL